MKYCIITYLAIFIFSFKGFSQEKNITHKVEKGETVTQIAQKYNVTPYDIYQLNPDAQSGLKRNTILLIPKKSGVSKANLQTRTHKVEPKETLFGIGKKYAVSEESLKESNPDLEKSGLQIGQTLIIPLATASKTVSHTQEKPVYHEVLSKETKYSIAKQYGITVEELEKRNPEIIPNLPVGYKLLIKGNPLKTEKIQLTEPKKEIAKATTVSNYTDYEIKPKETLYSLSKMSGLSQDELLKLNPALVNGVEIGMIVKIPSAVVTSQEVRKAYVSLSKKNNTGRKKMVLLLPFNISKIEGDTVNSTTMRLKKDRFLNMTLDFYSGALMAVDSARTLGIPIDISIFDSQETKNTFDTSNLNLENADAIIGPFYQSNVEKVAELMVKNNTPVISPLSKDRSESSKNGL